MEPRGRQADVLRHRREGKQRGVRAAGSYQVPVGGKGAVSRGLVGKPRVKGLPCVKMATPSAPCRMFLGGGGGGGWGGGGGGGGLRA